ncbi:hypothetical protein [Kineosporia babensis]|uniref:Uncharacterized protein n=1 Tax=Kineosporia babensis TaxID=499548 RepID=A0A9X1SVZ6_9ACTN|nr:hypothetical protein [Kineosporia babensis]MCD5314502.1 hypothetical protein [Kineosporia babensis]
MALTKARWNTMTRRRWMYATIPVATVIVVGAALVASPATAQMAGGSDAPDTTETTAPAPSSTSTAETGTEECAVGSEGSSAQLTDLLSGSLGSLNSLGNLGQLTSLTQAGCDGDVAVYFDDALSQLPADQTAWTTPFASEVFEHVTTSFGGDSASALPGLFMLHENKLDAGLLTEVLGGLSGVGSPVDAVYGDALGGNLLSGATLDSGAGAGEGLQTQLQDVIVKEACGQLVESVTEQAQLPTIPGVGEVGWENFCAFDFYNSTDRTEDADRIKAALTEAGGTDAAVVNDWFLPLSELSAGTGSAGELSALTEYFSLTDELLPTQGDASKLNLGEHVLFASAAAGTDLTGKAKEAFGSKFDLAQFTQAQKDFPQLTF